MTNLNKKSKSISIIKRTKVRNPVKEINQILDL